MQVKNLVQCWPGQLLTGHAYSHRLPISVCPLPGGSLSDSHGESSHSGLTRDILWFENHFLISSRFFMHVVRGMMRLLWVFISRNLGVFNYLVPELIS